MKPQRVMLFIGMLSSERGLFQEIGDLLQSDFGRLEMCSPVWQWNHTNYYEREMGNGLLRKFLFFKNFIEPDILPEIKLNSIRLEKKYLNINGGRRINLDPGYLNTAKVVLFSTKDFSHRIYMGHEIYGEITLFCLKGGYKPLPYTFPDFRTEEYLNLFNKARDIYRRVIKRI